MKTEYGLSDTSAKCSDCVYAIKNEQATFCRRYPPTVAMVPTPPAPGQILPGRGQVMTLSPTGMFPPVLPDWSCGEFQLKITN